MTGPDFKRRLKALGIKQKEFSVLIEITETQISRWAVGEVTVPGSIIFMIEALELLSQNKPETFKSEALARVE